MDVLNNDADLDSEITSRYTIVIAASKRARQIINGAPCDTKGAVTDKAVSIAVNEMIKSKIKIYPDGLPYEEEIEEEPFYEAVEEIIDFNADDADEEEYEDDLTDAELEMENDYAEYYGDEEAENGAEEASDEK